jgi:hypothetical protein
MYKKEIHSWFTYKSTICDQHLQSFSVVNFPLRNLQSHLLERSSQGLSWEVPELAMEVSTDQLEVPTYHLFLAYFLGLFFREYPHYSYGQKPIF